MPNRWGHQPLSVLEPGTLQPCRLPSRHPRPVVITGNHLPGVPAVMKVIGGVATRGNRSSERRGAATGGSHLVVADDVDILQRGAGTRLLLRNDAETSIGLQHDGGNLAKVADAL